MSLAIGMPDPYKIQLSYYIHADAPHLQNESIHWKFSSFSYYYPSYLKLYSYTFCTEFSKLFVGCTFIRIYTQVSWLKQQLK